MTIPVIDLLAYALMFFRISAIYFALPLFGDNPTPIQIRILVSLATAFCIIPVVSIPIQFKIPDSTAMIFVYVIKEVTVGLVIGFAARLAFDGLVMASTIVGYQMGFGTANLFVPDAEMQLNSFSAMHRIIMIMIFFTLNMHHTYFMAISESFRVIPITFVHYSSDLATFFVDATSQVFSTALQLAAPVLVALMFTMAALGAIARSVPQLNVFSVSFPVSFFVGLLVYIATLPLLPGWLEDHFEKTQETMMTSIHGLK